MKKRREKSLSYNPTLKDKISLAVFLSPTMVFVIIFIAFPIFFSGYLSLTEFNYAADDAPRFIGLKGYYDILVKDGFFHTALLNQMKFAVAYFVAAFVISLVLAIFVNELKKGTQIFQVIFYMPMIVPLSLVGITFTWILQPDMGIFNLFLRKIGLESLAIDWYGEPSTALYALVVARTWKMIGFTLIILLAGLQGIAKSLRESARVDGANFVQEIWFIVLPNLKPYMLISGIWILINSLKVFVLPQVITQGGPGVSTLTLYLYSWKLAFERLDMGQASQVSYITAAIILILAWVLNKIFKPETAQRG